MTVSNGNFIDEEGNVVNIVQLLRNGEATPIVGDDGHYMRAHSGWYTDENGVPVNLITLLGGGVSEAVSNWLDDHPEVTTTVQDASLTDDKFTATLKNKTIKDYVTPEMFGAKGDGSTDDVLAIESALAYIKSNTVAYTTTVFMCPTLVLNKRYYVSRNIIIPSDMHKLSVKGENSAVIKNGGFVSTGDILRYLTIDNIQFYDGETFIYLEYKNIEHGEYIIKNCKFMTCSDYAIKLERRSGFVYVDHCQFNGCAKAAYFKDCDNLTIENNWIYSAVDAEEDNHAVIYIYNPNESGSRINNNFFIPDVSQSGDNCAWIRAGGTAIIEKNRFSGENEGGNIHPVILANDAISKYQASPYNVTPQLVSFCDNPLVSGKTASILIDNFEGNLVIEKNNGWSAGVVQPIIELVNPDTTQYDDLSINHFQIRIKDNLGRPFKVFNRRKIANQGVDFVPNVLEKFMSSDPVYLSNTNFDFKYSNNANVFTITFPFESGITQSANSLRESNAFLIIADVNKAPNGAVEYNDPLVGILSYYVAYASGTINLYPSFNRISTGDTSLTYIPAVCGETTYITKADADSHVTAGTFTLSLTAQHTSGQQVINVKHCIPLGDLKPVGNILSN